MKRRFLVLASLLASLVLAPNLSVAAKDKWVSVRSPNFLLIGNGSEKEIRQVGARLEQFREAISRLFTNIRITSQVPTTVVVFKSRSSYRPFKVTQNNAGFFQSGPDVNYITLTTEVEGDQEPFNIIFHEYTHLLVNNTLPNAPSWFNEGLAEYYSTFSVTNDRKVVIGRPISSHVLLLRGNRMLPLRTLFQVNNKSPYYNERDKQSLFYAQSWALMHYLVLNHNQQRASQMVKFIELMSGKMPMEEAFSQAFQTTFEAMESELRAYIKQDRYVVMERNFESKLESAREMQSTPISEAEAIAYLGDLMLHCNRPEAETYLRKALVLDPNLAMAHASLGVFLFRHGKADAARVSLERAVAANSQNYLIHYYYASVLGRPPTDEVQLNAGYPMELAAKIRAELKKAIELRPDYPESYNLLAYVNLVTNTDIDETILMLTQALSASPGRIDFRYMLGQLYMNKDDSKAARPMLEQVAAAPDIDEKVRAHAKKLVQTIDEVEEQRARLAALRAANRGAPPGDGKLNSDEDQNPNDPSTTLRIALRAPAAGETQAQGTLVRVECDVKNFVFVVRAGEKLLRLRSVSFDRVGLTTYDDQVRGTVTCGARQPENPVVVFYIASADKQAKIDGTLTSLNFVPADFKLKP
jgi:tetratricopeptide (TPR) repeat protein